MKEVLSENNIKYMYVDICESVGKLKQFLKIRDTADACKEIREQHRAASGTAQGVVSQASSIAPASPASSSTTRSSRSTARNICSS